MSSKALLLVDQGTDFSQDFQLLDTNDDPLTIHEANGNPLYVATGQMRKSYSSTNNYSFDTALSNGLLTISLTAAASGNIAGGKYVFDIELDKSGVIDRIKEGFVTVKPQATK